MKRILLIFLSLLTMLLTACSPRPSDPLAYQKSALSAEVVLEKNGTRIGAVIRLGEMTDGPRDVEIVLTSPESIKGSTLERKNGSVTGRLGDLSVPTDERTFFLAELFSLDGTVTSAKTENGLTILTISGPDADYTLSLDAGGHPKSISGKNFVLEIVWLESNAKRG